MTGEPMQIPSFFLNAMQVLLREETAFLFDQRVQVVSMG